MGQKLIVKLLANINLIIEHKKNLCKSYFLSRFHPQIWSISWWLVVLYLELVKALLPAVWEQSSNPAASVSPPSRSIRTLTLMQAHFLPMSTVTWPACSQLNIALFCLPPANITRTMLSSFRWSICAGWWWWSWFGFGKLWALSGYPANQRQQPDDWEDLSVCYNEGEKRRLSWQNCARYIARCSPQPVLLLVKISVSNCGTCVLFFL